MNTKHSILIILLLLWILSTKSVCGTEEATGVEWQRLDAEAERMSRIGSGRIGKDIGSQWKALALNDTALTIAGHQLIANDTAWVILLNHRGDYLFQQHAVKAADSVWREAADRLTRISSGSYHGYEPTLLRLGISQLSLKRRARDSLGEAAASNLRNLKYRPLPGQAASLFALGFLYDKLNRYPESDSCLQELIRLARFDSTCNPFYAIRALIHLGEIQSKLVNSNVQNAQRAQDSAIALGTIALELAESRIGPNDTTVAFVLNRLGDYYARQGLQQVSESLWTRALAINQASLPEEDIEYQGSIFRMGNVFAATGRFTRAEEFLRTAVRLRIRTQGPKHPEVAAMMTSLARVQFSMGKYDEAEAMFNQALDIRRQAFEPDHVDIAASLIDLGRIESARAHFTAAQRLYEEALGIRRRSLGERHALTADCLVLLADLFETWNRPSDALYNFRKALAIRESFLSPYHPSIASSLERIASLQSDIGAYASADQSFRRALDIVDSAIGAHSADHWELLMALGENLGRLGQRDSAESALMAAWNGLRREQGVSSITVIRSLMALVKFYSSQNQSEKGLPFVEQLEDELTHTASGHPVMAEACETAARYLWRLGRVDDARSWAERGLAIRSSTFWDGCTAMSERDLLAVNGSLRKSRDLLISICTKSDIGPDSTDPKLALLSLTAKVGVFDAIWERQRRMRRIGNAGAVAIADSLRIIQHNLSSLYVRSMRPDQPDLADQYRNMTKAKRDLESALARCLEIGAEPSQKWGTSDPPLPFLEGNRVLVNYVRYKRETSADSQADDCYLAVVFAPSGKSATVLLGPAQPIDDAVEAYRKTTEAIADFGRPSGALDGKMYWEVSAKLTSLIWRPLAGLVPDSVVVLISPDDKLEQISFAALPIDDSSYLIERHAIGYMTSPGELLTRESDSSASSGLLLCGDADYDASEEARRSVAVAEVVESGRPPVLTLRASLGACDSNFAAHVQALPGSGRELRQAEMWWREKSNEPVIVCRGSAASEENLRALAPGKRVVHIATHGYFLSPECQSTTQASSRIARLTVSDNPLLLSGLFLAGANQRFGDSGKVASDDGVLTAEEVVNLDLAGTERVILSGCETGMGLSKAGSGIYGLRRAFQVAGAKTVISSLWPVSDAGSARVMANMYGCADQDVITCLRAAELQELRSLRARGQADHPFYWAAFIVSE